MKGDKEFTSSGHENQLEVALSKHKKLRGKKK